MTTPFTAYSGDASYVFVCYSHADTERVYADLAMLHGAGLNIWYDEGISPGSEWTEELGKALKGASHLLFYTSNRSIESRHCRDEINFAHNHDIPILSIHLEEVTLPVGLELSLSSTQAIKRKNHSDTAYVEKMKSALSPSVFGAASPTPSSVIPERQTKNRLIVPALFTALLIFCALGYFNRSTILGHLYLSAPFLFFESTEQQIGFATTSDDVRIAYAETGEGPPLLLVLGWATHLEDGMNSPTYDAEGLIAMTSESFRLIRFDGRGFGLSDRDVKDLSVEARVKDIEAIVATLDLDQFYLYALSSGGQPSIAYAAKHPDKVAGMVLASTFGSYEHRDPEHLKSWTRTLERVAESWDDDSEVDVLIERLFRIEENHTFMQVVRTFLRRSTNGQTIHDFFTESMKSDVTEIAKDILAPTMVMHGRDDDVVPLIGGRDLAALIPGARFVIVEGAHGEGVGGTARTRQRILDFFHSLQQKNPISEIRTTQP